MKVGRMATVGRLAFLALAVASTATNFFLARQIKKSYREMLRIQLDPSNARAFERFDLPKEQGKARVVLLTSGRLDPAASVDLWHLSEEGYRRVNERFTPVLDRAAHSR